MITLTFLCWPMKIKYKNVAFWYLQSRQFMVYKSLTMGKSTKNAKLSKFKDGNSPRKRIRTMNMMRMYL
jgi:hypothetical protein